MKIEDRQKYTKNVVNVARSVGNIIVKKTSPKHFIGALEAVPEKNVRPKLPNQIG